MDAMAAQLTATQTEAAAGKAAALEHIEKHLDAAEQKIGERCDLQAAGAESLAAQLAAVEASLGERSDSLAAVTEDLATRCDAVQNSQVAATASLATKLTEVQSGLGSKCASLSATLDKMASSSGTAELAQQVAELSTKLVALGSKHDVTADALAATDSIIGGLTSNLQTVGEKHGEFDLAMSALGAKVAELGPATVAAA
eukprot:SAG22_NODE_7855_length_702_cov_0.684909_1_plen_199_part_10